ncbi:MAG TPA: GIY-YIG nuclease family protein [Bacteroidales bacterium]|nr:GIY-YIG nuclease family protein [Bacteroidales bacterium]HRW97271.1 GIY-YIG nuclease family protein [Bacteroidales bacterium]
MFYTYVLYSDSHDKTYTGFTSDLQKRLNAHNDDRNSGWTKNFRPWRIVYYETYESKKDAMKRTRIL